MLPEYRGQADAQSTDTTQGDQAVPRDHRLPQDQGIAEPHQPGLHVRTSQRPLAERHHLHTDEGRLALPSTWLRFWTPTREPWWAGR
jgi:hypothetical protein